MLFEVVVNLPLTLPPVVIGYFLLLLLGRRGWAGPLLEAVGIRIIFTWKAAVIASAVVGFPLLVRSIRIGMESIDPQLIQASRTLGAPWYDTLVTIILPLSLHGIMAGSSLMFARSLGEFGATIIVAGNIPGVTQTIPLAIYEYAGSPTGEEMAMSLCIVSVAISLVALFLHEVARQEVGEERLTWRLRVNVKKRFGNFALMPISPSSGERIGIFGESGSGKSTLVGLLAGLREPDEGEIVLDGECLFSSRNRINVPPERRHIAIVFQQPSLFPHLSVRSNLLYGYKRRAVEHRRVDFEALVGVLQLEGLLARGVNNLSGGEKQRVALGRAVLASPRLLLMDEPLSALDDDLKFQIIPYLRSVSEQFGIPFLFISHSLVEMRLMTDKVLVVAGGRIAEQTTTDALARSRMGASPVGYINLLKLPSPRRLDGLFAYQWGSGRTADLRGERRGGRDLRALLQGHHPLQAASRGDQRPQPPQVHGGEHFRCRQPDRRGADLRRKNAGCRDDASSRDGTGSLGGVRTLCGDQGVCVPASRLKSNAVRRTRRAAHPEDREPHPSGASLVTHRNYLKSFQ